MTKAEFERLCAQSSAYGEKLGVAVTLRMVVTERSAFTPSGARIMMRVFRLVPGEPPREYAAGHGYRPDAKGLKDRIFADIKTTAERLAAGATRSATDGSARGGSAEGGSPRKAAPP
jgi:hypothetical protein